MFVEKIAWCDIANLVAWPGFTHASFALGYEAGINKSSIDGNLVPLGALITLVQKGLQYVEMEANLDNVCPSCQPCFLLFLSDNHHLWFLKFARMM